jgi:uncharacterized protein YcfJ
MSILTVISTAVVATLVMSNAHGSERARVTDVQPIIENRVVTTVQPLCHNVPVHQPVYDQGGAVLGGIIGGVIGNEVFRNGNRSVGTGIGVLIGSQVGGNNGSAVVGYRQHCTESYSNQLIPTTIGYRVSYLLDGVVHVTNMSYNPGHYVTVERNVTVR